MTKFKQFILPAVIVLLGAGAALATNDAKNAQATESGYYFDSSTSRCIEVQDVQCTSTPGDLCTWEDENNETHSLRRFINSTMCGTPLYKP